MGLLRGLYQLGPVWLQKHKGNSPLLFGKGGCGPPLPPGRPSIQGGADDGGWQPERLLSVMLATSILSCVHPHPALALLGSKKHQQKQDSELRLQEMMSLGLPTMKNLGLSGGVGLIAAISFKAVGRGLAVIVGAAYAIIQLGVYLGYVQVDWSRVHRDVSRQIQRKQVRRKGKQSEIDKVMAEGLAILSHGVPSVGGFCAGFAWGLQL